MAHSNDASLATVAKELWERKRFSETSDEMTNTNTPPDMLSAKTPVFAVAFLVCASLSFGADLEALSRSSVWEVRYCIPIKFEYATPAAKTVLERLCGDKISRVASHAFAAYSRCFVALDGGLVRSAFSRGDFLLSGITVTDIKVFESASFWLGELERTTQDSIRARAVRAIGLCGSESDRPKLVEYLVSRNPYLLTELALALHRLGDTKGYLAALDSVLGLPAADSLSYQTMAIDYLIQTHPERTRKAWDTLHRQTEASKDIQPGWIFEHIVQEDRLP